MATKKKAAKPAAKKPVSKTVKKAVKPKKQTKPASRNVVKAPIKKQGAKNPVSKQVKGGKPSQKNHAKPVAKNVMKPLVKKYLATAVKSKIVAKSLPRNTPKPLVKTVTKKSGTVQKPIEKPMAKKIEIKRPIAKEPLKAIAGKAPVVKVTAKNVKDIKIAHPKPLVIPKFTTKTSRKYQPEFTKSVLDQPKNDPGAPIMRYNDTDLAEFRDLIQRKLNAAKKELSYLQGLITRKDEMGGDESDNRYMTMEDGSLSMEREQLSQMASRQITFIDHLEKALMRIENKTYGICRVTGKLIDKARLRAVPHATLSIEAKMGIVK